MRKSSTMFAAATAPLSLSGLTTGREATASSAARASLAPPGRYVARFIESVVFAMLVALVALPGPARAQTVTINSVTASPASVQPGHAVTFTATMTASQNLSNYPVELSLAPSGSSRSTMQEASSLTFKAGVALSDAYSWTVPASTKAGAYTLYVAVYNPAYSVKYAQTTTTLTIAAASAAAPTDMEPPVISGTAQVGKVLSSTTGTWTGATSYAYQWAGNSANIAGATAATYTPVSTDAGHTLTSTVTATGSSGPSASATSAPTVAIVAASTGSPPVTASGSVPFVALHTYYMSPTGSDSNNGLTAATAWATPSHAVNCGDVIIAAAGSYSDLQSFGSVSSCPSTSGGVDGTGGVYFATLLCGGSYVGACDITTKAATSGNTVAIEIATNNWAVEGWYVNTSGHGRAFEGYACSGVIHHIAFINDISADNLQAADTNDCGKSGSYGVDYFATVGVIAQNSAQDPICLAAIDVVGPGVYNTAVGTHYFVYGNFSYANQNPTCRSISDTEDYMADTWDYHGVTTQGIFADNIGFDADRMCIQVFEQSYSTVTPTIKIYDNTCFQDNNYTGGNWMNGEINITSTKSPMTYVVTTYNNVAYQPLSVSNGGGGVAAYVVGNLVTTYTGGGSGLQNILKATNSSCKGSYCNSTFDTQAWGSSAMLGTETYANPSFTNTTDLLGNRTGVPNCNAFATTTACMGWNAKTSTLSTASIISDLVPTASGTSGKGYQLPFTTCAANADYPTWLKGIVYLQWNGSTLTENSDLVTKPCNM